MFFTEQKKACFSLVRTLIELINSSINFSSLHVSQLESLFSKAS